MKRSSVQKFKRRCLAILFGLGVALAGLEAAFRIWYPQALYAIRYSYLGWSHVPGARFMHAGEQREFVTHVAYNSQGLRDSEYSIAKPPGIQRVLLFGDSYAEALEVELEQTHAKLLEQQLNAGVSKPRVQVIDFGVSAYDTAQEWWYLAREGVHYQPDLVILIWSGETNSVFVQLVDGEPVFLEPQYTVKERAIRAMKTALKSHSHLASLIIDRLRMNRSLDEFLWTVRLGAVKAAVKRGQADTIAQRAGAAGSSWELEAPKGSGPASVHWYLSENWPVELAVFRALEQTCRRHGAHLLVATLYTRHYKELALRLASAGLQQIPIVNLQQSSDEEEQRLYHYSKDGHYNPRGHEKAARLLHQSIVGRQLLQELP